MGTTPRNEGEGNKTADRNYREATRKFVESERGQEEIARAGEVAPGEEREIRRAEEQAKARAKDHDPEELQGRSQEGRSDESGATDQGATQGGSAQGGSENRSRGPGRTHN